MCHFVKTDIFFRGLAYLYSTNWISWKYSKKGHFSTWNITSFKRFDVFQRLLGKVTVTNETFCGNRHIYLGFSISGHIL